MDFLKQRLVGALFILGLAVAFIPSIFSGEGIALLAAQTANADLHPYQEALIQQLASTQSAPAIMQKASQVSSHAEAWSVRVGSFSDPAMAQQLQQKLRQYGYEAYLQSADNQLYNVLVGPELVASNAQAVLVQLQGQLELNGVVVPYEPILYVQNTVQRG